MKFRLRQPAIGALCLLPSIGWADLSPAEFVTEMTALYAAQGLTLSYADQTESGGVVTLSDAKIDTESDVVSMSVAVGDIQIAPTDQDGFDLIVTNAPLATGTFSSDQDGIRVEGSFELRSDGHYLVRAVDQQLVFRIDYSTVGLTYDFEDGLASGGPAIEIAADGSGLEGDFTFDKSSNTVRYDLTASALDIGMDAPEDSGMAMEYALTYAGITMKGAGPVYDMTDPLAAYTSPQTTTITIGAESSNLALTVSEDGAPVEIGMVTGTSEITVATGAGQLDYLFLGQNVEATVSGSALPLPPVQIQMEGYESRVALPVAPADQEGVVALKVGINKLAVDESLWAMIDPSQAIPRDALDILIDLEGAGTASETLLSPTPGFADGFPFEMSRMALKDLRISGAGVELTGSGGGTFDNSGPFPVPEGAIDLKVVGLNGLVGTLAEIGLLAPEQTVPVQMMLGMFARPTGEPDVFTSRIEAGPDGVTANGVPLQ